MNPCFSWKLTSMEHSSKKKFIAFPFFQITFALHAVWPKPFKVIVSIPHSSTKYRIVSVSPQTAVTCRRVWFTSPSGRKGTSSPHSSMKYRMIAKSGTAATKRLNPFSSCKSRICSRRKANVWLCECHCRIPWKTIAP